MIRQWLLNNLPIEWLRANIPLINKITKWIILGPLALWAVWEIILAALRQLVGTEVRFISQMGRHLAQTGLASLAYFSCGLAAHIYINWWRPTWTGHTATVLGVSWWLIGLAYFVADILDPNHIYWPVWAQWVRYAPIVGCLGAMLALLCFPQETEWLPGVAHR
jgi:hypothetical protein